MKIYHNPRCSKSREALNIIESNNIKVKIINYIKTGLTINEIHEILSKLDTDAINIVRTKEKLWQTKYKEKKMIDDEIIRTIVENPILLERPIVITERKGVIGRPPENIRSLIN